MNQLVAAPVSSLVYVSPQPHSSAGRHAAHPDTRALPGSPANSADLMRRFLSALLRSLSTWSV